MTDLKTSKIKKLIKITTIFLTIFFIIFFSLLIIGYAGLKFTKWYRGWTPFMDDGPFHGKIRKDCPQEKPDHITKIWDGKKLKVYKSDSSIEAATVALQDKNGKILWCIYATGYDDTSVYDIEFKDYKTFPFNPPRVRGIVYWTYGAEGTWWYIERNGKLKEYWYSW